MHRPRNFKPAPIKPKRSAKITDHIVMDPRAVHMNRQMRTMGWRPQAPAPAPPEPASAPIAIPPLLPTPDPVAAANDRAAEMNTIGAYAAKRGVSFDAPMAISSRMSAAQARLQVLEAAAAADEALVTRSTPSVPNSRASSDAEMWGVAIARAAARAGLQAPK